jgi:GNAT superfamily N-acetyltransferase
MTLDVALLDASAVSDAHLVDELCQLINDVYADSEKGMWAEGATRTTPEEVAALMAAGELAVARLDGAVVGSVRVRSGEPSVGEFGMLVADQRVRGEGVGRALVTFAEDWALRQGFTVLQLEVLSPREWSLTSKQFLDTWYRRIGFEVVRRGQFEDAYPGLASQLATPCDFVIYWKHL